MPASPVPFVHPNEITFHSRQGPQTEQFCVYNPFPYDVVFKADNPDPSSFCLSLTQGLVSSSNKIYIDLTCTSGVTTLDGVLQVRFYRCFRSRHGPRHHGQKNHVQQYVGFREIKLSILTDHSEARISPEEGIASLSTSGFPDPLIGSNLDSAASRSSARRIKALAGVLLIRVMTIR
jgi:hypothetical protein